MNNDEFYLGTALKLTAIIARVPSMVYITVKSPSGVVLVDEAEMTNDTDTVWSYIYQSDANGVEGDYVAIFKAVEGIYEGITEDTFTLIKQS